METEDRVSDLGSEPPQLCEKCRRVLDETGWCKSCAENRAMGFSFLMAAASFAIGFGACTYSLNPQVSQKWSDLAMWLLFGSPLVWIVVYLVLKRRPG